MHSDNKNYGHIGIQSWLHVRELAVMVQATRQLGLTSTKPGQITRQYIQVTIPLIQKLLKLPSLDLSIEELLTYLRGERVDSAQLNPTKLGINILKEMVEETKDDADFKNWKKTIEPLIQSTHSGYSKVDLEELLKSNINNSPKLFDKE